MRLPPFPSAASRNDLKKSVEPFAAFQKGFLGEPGRSDPG